MSNPYTPTYQELESLAKSYGNSFFILDMHKIRQNRIKWMNEVEIAYPLKVNYALPILTSYASSGCWAEVSSIHEWNYALQAGFSSNKIIINGPIHSLDFVEKAIHHDSLIQIDNESQWNDFKELVLKSKKHTSFGIRIAHPAYQSRFGITTTSSLLFEIAEFIESHDVSISSLHIHLCEGARSTQSFIDRFNALKTVKNTFFKSIDIPYFNIGGGFYSDMPHDLSIQFGENIPNTNDYLSIIKELKKDLPPKTSLIVEAGNALVADTMSFYSKATYIHNKNILVSASIWDINPTKSSRTLPIEVISDSINDRHNDCYSIVGESCMESDILVSTLNTSIQKGDWLVFHQTGGYTTSLRPSFIHPHKPILSYENNIYTCIRKAGEALYTEY